MLESSKNNNTCIKCKTDFVYFPNETWWDYSGCTNTKLTTCPNCGCVQAVKYEEQPEVNFDIRYYEYNRHRAI